MHHDTAEMTESAAHMAIDPVCGIKVDIGARGPSFEHRGETYYFCSAGCRTKFSADPERYLTKKGEDQMQVLQREARKAASTFLAPLNEDERETLNALLRKLAGLTR